MHPILISAGPFVLHSYTVMLLLAVTVGIAIFVHEARRTHRDTEVTLRAAVGGLLGGVLGAKLSMIVFLGPAGFVESLSVLPFSGASVHASGVFLSRLGSPMGKERLGEQPFGFKSHH